MHQASAAWGEKKGGAVPWENPVDEPFSSGKDARSQQLCTMYRTLTVLILSIYGKLFFLQSDRFLHFLS